MTLVNGPGRPTTRAVGLSISVHFDCALWVHKACEMPAEDFRREVETELTGKEEEPSELSCFKVYKSQIPVIEQAINRSA